MSTVRTFGPLPPSWGKCARTFGCRVPGFPCATFLVGLRVPGFSILELIQMRPSRFVFFGEFAEAPPAVRIGVHSGADSDAHLAYFGTACSCGMLHSILELIQMRPSRISEMSSALVRSILELIQMRPSRISESASLSNARASVSAGLHSVCSSGQGRDRWGLGELWGFQWALGWRPPWGGGVGRVGGAARKVAYWMKTLQECLESCIWAMMLGGGLLVWKNIKSAPGGCFYFAFCSEFLALGECES